MHGLKQGAHLRAEAARAVDAVVSAGRSLDAALAEAESNVRADDQPLLRMLCYGTLRFHWRLREQLRELVSKPLKARDSVIESLLAIGLFQLTDTRVPDHAAVSMTVEAARMLRRPKYAGLINAVLRNFLRRRLEDREPGSDEARYCHPQWLIGRLQEDWPDDWQRLLAANNERAPMWLRVNAQRTTTERYLAELAAVDPDAPDGGDRHDTLPGFDQAIRLHGPMPVNELPGFTDGVVSVQDAAAQLAAPWLLAGRAPDAELRILDACAAPGGKTGHLAELAGRDAGLIAIDSDPDRAALIDENLARLRLEATVVVADAARPADWWDGRPFDRILLDAPCSASGVIRRHPDIKLNRRDEDVSALAASQAALLTALWPLLRAGGRLLYVTCSVLAAENDTVVRGFIEAHGDATEQRVLPNNNIRDLMCAKPAGFQILTGTCGLDGFYFACLEKVS